MITYKEHTPTPTEFNSLSDAVGCGTKDSEILQEALKNTLYSLCVYDDNKLIGYGRIIGDKTIFLYIHNVMVLPEYQNQHIGSQIVTLLLEQVDVYRQFNSDIRTYICAAKGKESFYEKFGFITRPNDDLGPGMILY